MRSRLLFALNNPNLPHNPVPFLLMKLYDIYIFLFKKCAKFFVSAVENNINHSYNRYILHTTSKFPLALLDSLKLRI